MRRALLIIALFLASAGPSPADVEASALIGRYEPLDLSYTVSRDEKDRALTRFQLPTAHGALDGTLLDSAATSRARFTHVPSGSTLAATIAAPAGASTTQIRLDYSRHATDLRFEVGRDGSDLRHVEAGGLDCSGLADDPLALSLDAALRRWARSSAELAAAPEAVGEIGSALALVTMLPAVAPGCGPGSVSAAGGCNLDHPDYQGCFACCDEGSVLAGVVCTASALIGCKGPWCQASSGDGCSILRRLTRAICVGHNCNGKPGDPGCPFPLPLCTGLCMEFCGPGWSSSCGACPDGKVCCA